MRRSDQEWPRGSESGQAGRDGPRPVPHQRRALRAIPSLARFLRPQGPGDARIGRVAAGRAPEGTREGAGRDAEADRDDRGTQGIEGPSDAAPRTDALETSVTESSVTESSAMESTAPATSAAELRDLAELADLLAEFVGLVHDLGALIMGLMTAATAAGDRRVRTFTIPAELAELAFAHQELKAELQALDTRFEASTSQREREVLRDCLAALTERATRAVSAAAAAVVPQEVDSSGRPSEGTAPSGESGAPLREPSREETGVQSASEGTPYRGPARWRDAPISDRRLAPVAVALDAPDIDVAAHWATLVTPHVSTVKIGLELYLRYGPAVVATVRGGSGVQVFLDLKLHDIPNTVAAASRAVAKLHPEILTVHAAGGADMIRAAVEAAPDTIVAGVTLLTSIGDKDLAELGIDGSVSDAVRRMAVLAVSAGARGLVCSPQEVTAVRGEVGPDILLITPGIRPAGATSDDQARVATPEEALKAGADLLVIGRPITKSADPGAAAAAIAGCLRRAVLLAGGEPLHGISTSPVIWVAGGGHRGHTGITVSS
jgi:orotidine-5'-phosphate decarboxylase